jgi:peptide/nickel transport system ATP-binding protein
LNPKLAIGSALAEAVGLISTDDVEQEVGRLLELVQLPPAVARRKPSALSGGERQRVAIARALAVRPEVIICDEVVSALDVSVQAQVLNLLRELQADLGVAFIFISHDLAVVRHVADRILVMSDGVVVEEGAASVVLEHPRHPYTKRLLDAVVDTSPIKGTVLLP